MTRALAPFTVAVVQDRPVFLNLAASLDRAVSLVERAAATGARVIAFPETWLPGYPVWLDFAPRAAIWNYGPAKALFGLLYANSLELGSSGLTRLGAAAKAHDVWVVMGATERRGGSLYNTMLYLGPDGELWGIHRKLMPTYSERMIWGRGDGSTLAVLDTACGKLGGLICWEHWMPLARAAMHAKLELIHVAQWPMVKEMNLVCSRHYAFEGQCFVLAAGAVLAKRDLDADLAGPEGQVAEARALLREIDCAAEELLLQGGSAILGPDGGVLAGAYFGEPTIVTATIDPREAIEGRLLLDVDGHYARPDVFRLTVDERVHRLVNTRERRGHEPVAVETRAERPDPGV